MKKLLILATTIFGLIHATMAQVPSYVPTNGLVGWWPFNGNANDESGNSFTLNNFSVLFNQDGQRGSVAEFNGNAWLEADTSIFRSQTPITITFWARTAKNYAMDILGQACGNDCNDDIRVHLNTGQCGYSGLSFKSPSHFATAPGVTSDSNWHHFALVLGNNNNYSYSNFQFFIDGVFVAIGPNQCGHNWGGWTYNPNANYHLTIGKGGPLGYFYNGRLDDIGIWKRALTQQEINSLYNNSNACPESYTVQPISKGGLKGSDVSFNTVFSGTGAAFQWQSDAAGLGWQDILNNGQYIGANTNNLSVRNLNVSNHNQRFRIIASKTGCVYISNITTLRVTDVLQDSSDLVLAKDSISKLNNLLANKPDTLYVGSNIITDTLVISIRTGLPIASSTINLLKVYPNPAATVLNIVLDKPGYYTAKLSGVTGQTIVTPTSGSIDISNLANGVYILTIYDAHENLVSTNKILIIK